MKTKMIKLIIIPISLSFLFIFIFILFFVNLKFIEGTTDADPYLPGPVGYVCFGIFCSIIIISVLICLYTIRVSFTKDRSIFYSFFQL